MVQQGNNWQNNLWHPPSNDNQDQHTSKDQDTLSANNADTFGQIGVESTQNVEPDSQNAGPTSQSFEPDTTGQGFAAPPQSYGVRPSEYVPNYQHAYAQTYNAAASTNDRSGRSRAWIVALVAVILFFVLMLVGMISCTSLVNTTFTSSGLFGATDSTDALMDDTVAIIYIDGTIQYDNTTSSPEGLRAQLDRAEENPLIKAVVLRVNSGGGVATAGEEMSIYVRDFSKPIVVSSASTNASAAYEISSQSDYIFTAETTAIGSIGTAMQVTDVSDLLDKLGISIENITSSDSKDSSYGFRELTEEERTYYQNMVNQINQTFIDRVAIGRSMSVDEVTALANGLTYTGIDAVQNGLADEIGTLEDAVDKACELAGISDAETIVLRSGTSDLMDVLGLRGEADDSVTGAIEEWENNVGSSN